jgi:hypothetical protein
VIAVCWRQSLFSPWPDLIRPSTSSARAGRNRGREPRGQTRGRQNSGRRNLRRFSQNRSNDAQQRRLRGSVAGAHCFLNRRSRILRFSKSSGATHATRLATPPWPRARAFCACRMRATPAAARDMPRLHHAAAGVATRSAPCGHCHTAHPRLDAAPASPRDRRGCCPPHRPPCSAGWNAGLKRRSPFSPPKLQRDRGIARYAASQHLIRRARHGACASDRSSTRP